MKKLAFKRTDITIKSYAKLNLDLTIGNWDDAKKLHRITSKMQMVDLFETLVFDIELYCGDKGLEFSVNNPEQNCSDVGMSSVYRALKLWAGLKGVYLKVHLDHNDAVPSGKGLGIASSNAGFSIRLFEDLAEQVGIPRFKRDNLISLSMDIGSDVPFFSISNGCALVKGCGDIIEDVRGDNKTFLLHIPQHNAISSNAYKLLYENGVKVHNSFTEININKKYHSELKKITSRDDWKLTGSGSAFFIQNPSKSVIEESKKWTGLKTVICNSVNL